MLAIQIRFTAGRYSATPWGRQVNEGLVEWPPSPWRLLRALVAVWQRAVPDVPAETMARLLHAMVPLPEYRLPRAGEGHSRHYMPLIESGQETRSLIFDAFVTVPRDAAIVAQWPDLLLSAEQEMLLGQLLERLPYFGRAESWCRAALAVDTDAAPEFLCRPVQAGPEGLVPGDLDLVPVLAADSALSPSALLERLMVDTATLRQMRRDPYRPPGSLWATYGRPRAALEPGKPRATSGRQEHEAPLPVREAGETALGCGDVIYLARYAIANRVRPQMLRTVDVAEALRRAVMSRDGSPKVMGGERERPSWRFSGKDEDGQPLRGHQHVFYLPVDEDGDGFLDHLHVCLRPARGFRQDTLAQQRFTQHEAQTLERLVQVRGVADDPLRLTLLHLGPLEQALGLVGTLGSGTRWESITPYMLPRHPKPTKDGSGWRADSPEQQLRRELAERFGEPLATATTIEPVEIYRRNGQTWGWQSFRRWRTDHGQPPPYRVGLGVRLIFPEAVRGPIAVGYGCHFGLGQFRCLEGDER